MPIFALNLYKFTPAKKNLHEYVRGVGDKYEVCCHRPDQPDQPFSSPMSAGLGQRMMSSAAFKSYEAKQNKQIADIKSDLNINLGQVTDEN